MQNASHNAALCANIINAGFQIVMGANDISLARINLLLIYKKREKKNNECAIFTRQWI